MRTSSARFRRGNEDVDYGDALVFQMRQQVGKSPALGLPGGYDDDPLEPP